MKTLKLAKDTFTSRPVKIMSHRSTKAMRAAWDDVALQVGKRVCDLIMTNRILDHTALLVVTGCVGERTTPPRYFVELETAVIEFREGAHKGEALAAVKIDLK
jgi:hypothetical protein